MMRRIRTQLDRARRSAMLAKNKTLQVAVIVYLSASWMTSLRAEDWPELDRVTAGSRWPHPKLTDKNFQNWIEFIRPTEKELEWRKVRWHVELADAQVEARRLQRPILLWTMNGHPCGET